NKSLFTVDEQVFHANFPDEKTFVISMNINYEPFNFILVLVHKERLTNSDLLLIKDETERFLSIANYYAESQANDKMNELLFSLSSLLYSSTDKNIVLTNIVESLDDIYAGFSHYLLLSHDFETDDSLPIKSIEYSDDEEKKSSSKAFITGEVQTEERTN